MQKNRQSWAVNALFVGILLILFSWLVNNLSIIGNTIAMVLHVLSPFLIGAFIAYLVHGPVGALERYMEKIRFLKNAKLGLRRSLAITVVFLLTLFATVLLLYIVLPEVVRSLAMLVTKIQPFADTVSGWLTGLLQQFNIPSGTITSLFASFQSVVANVLSSMGNIAAWAYDLMVSFLTSAFNLGLGILISVYILFGKESLSDQFKKALYASVKVETADTVISIMRRSNQIFSIFLYVRIFCSVLVGVITYAVLAPFGVNYVVLISVISGVFNFVPIFGPITATIVCCLLLFIVSPAQMFWYLVLSLVLQQVEGNIIEPKMMGDRMGLPALWVLFGVLVGGGFFGVLGMIIGVPVVAIGYSLAVALIESRLKKKQVDFA